MLSTLPASIVLSIKASPLVSCRLLVPLPLLNNSWLTPKAGWPLAVTVSVSSPASPSIVSEAPERCQFAGVGGLPHRSGVFIDVDLRAHALDMIRVMARRAGNRDQLWRGDLGRVAGAGVAGVVERPHAIEVTQARLQVHIVVAGGVDTKGGDHNEVHAVGRGARS